ncbi:MAG: twin-arginine translocation signal domain-containing protein, partial [Planctomycetes bacterium]|nr:twin-arginine translocation signal domain-containing protein [Planctomycetota bacterium]
MSQDIHSPIRISGARVELGDEVPAEIAAEMHSVSQSRRDFLKVTGLAAMGLMIASCTGKPKHVIPTVREEKGIKPGLHYWYASTCAGCNAACGILAKVRDGRPIKLEGNELHPLSRGGLCAKGQGSLLGLYDADRLRAPQEGSTSITWSTLYERMLKALEGVGSKQIRLLTSTHHGPSMQRAIAIFLKRWPDAKVITYDAIGYDALLNANDASFGVRQLATLSFDKAEVVLSFGADFLGTWISPVEYSKAWASTRTLEGESPKFSRTIVLESAMSLTGSNADERIQIRPSQRGAWVAGL